MTIPDVRLIDGKVQIVLEKRHAEILGMLLGTFSPQSVHKTINGYYEKLDTTERPALCASHSSVNVPNWETQDTMVTSQIHFGIAELLWPDRDRS